MRFLTMRKFAAMHHALVSHRGIAFFDRESIQAAAYHGGRLTPASAHAMTGFAFLSNTSFLKVPTGDQRRPYAVAGIAWDGSVTNRPGARFGPRAIREASHMLCDGTHPHFNVSPETALTYMGDLPLPNTSLAAMREAMLPLAAPLIREHHMAWIGGDHSVTLRAVARLPRLARPATRGHPLRCALRHLGRPLRRTQRPRDLGL